MDELAPKVIEPQIEESQIEEKKLTPEDICSSMVSVYGPRYARGIDNLSGRQAKRLAKALVLYPLMGSNYQPTSALENDLFNMGDRLLQAKFSLMLHTLAEKADLQQEEAKVEEQPNNPGDNNG